MHFSSLRKMGASGVDTDMGANMRGNICLRNEIYSASNLNCTLQESKAVPGAIGGTGAFHLPALRI